MVISQRRRGTLTVKLSAFPERPKPRRRKTSSTSANESSVPRTRLTSARVEETSTSEVSSSPAETMPLRTVASASSAIMLAAASRASLTVDTLMPFSKREEDSERRLRRPLVLRIDLPLKTAASRTTRLDFSEISVA